MTDAPNSHYTPFTAFPIHAVHERDAPWGDHHLKLVKGNSTHTVQMNREDLLMLADSIHAATGVRFVERDEVRQALANVTAFLRERDKMSGFDPEHIVGANHAVLGTRDLRILMEAAEGAIQ
ncbi:hypothetical protein SEA_OTTAWA_96 [Arthrobacter phage Ottawa]|nr:hypothetical protein SEA_KHARCHO_96 [Arthrobacter phage Kharcho]WIC89328.1 hypothetical protein SEA_OTTAWA_96 [Arthrobacter phage Ottawa]